MKRQKQSRVKASLSCLFIIIILYDFFFKHFTGFAANSLPLTGKKFTISGKMCIIRKKYCKKSVKALSVKF